jgi:glycosyltransferase involved in cell wall biosynthesis
MKDTQIICVNDGSSDNSRVILQEYADQDSHIEIIDKFNAGLSSARNAAYSHIKVKYSLFVDSDDWSDLDLCEKTYHKAEESGAPMVFFLCHGEGHKTPSYKWITPSDKTTAEEKTVFCDSYFPGAPVKLWRTDFLLGNNLSFPEGLIYEDQFINWKAITLASKISFIPEELYHYRYRTGSIMRTKSERTFDIVPIYNMVREYLVESGNYSIYQNKFVATKLKIWYANYFRVPAPLKPKFITMIRDNMNEEDREYCRTAPKKQLPKAVKNFYKMVAGARMAMTKYRISMAIDFAVKMPERLVRHCLIKPIKKCLKAV